MKKIILWLLLVSIPYMSLANQESLIIPMTIFWDITSSQNIVWSTLNIYGNNVLLTAKTLSWNNYGSNDAFQIEQRINLNSFSWVLKFEVLSGNTHYTNIPVTLSWNYGCSNTPSFQSNKLCKYDLNLNQATQTHIGWWSSGSWNNGSWNNGWWSSGWWNNNTWDTTPPNNTGSIKNDDTKKGSSNSWSNTQDKNPSLSSSYIDVSKDSWVFPYVSWLKSAGIISDNPYFYPKNNITRVELLKMVSLARWIDGEYDPKYTFRDINDRNFWWTKYVCSANKLWYISWNNDYFRPYDSITRAEALKIILNYKAGDIAFDPNYSFEDILPTQWWSKYISTAAKNGYISKNNTHFRPQDNITREEVAKIVYNVFLGTN